MMLIIFRHSDPADQDRRHYWGGEGVPLDFDHAALIYPHFQIKTVSTVEVSWEVTICISFMIYHHNFEIYVCVIWTMYIWEPRYQNVFFSCWPCAGIKYSTGLTRGIKIFKSMPLLAGSIVKPRPQTPKPQTQKPKTKGPWAYTKISWATTTTTPPQILSMKEGSHNKPQRVRKVQSGPPYLSSKNNLRCTARGRTWSSPPCSMRTSSVLLVASLSKCQHSE